MTEINVTYLNGFNDEDKVKANIAVSLLKNAINSTEFHDKILNVSAFKKNKIKRKTGNKKYSNQEILELILSGEDLNNPADNIINLKLNLYDGEKNEIGHTNMGSLEISTYRGYFNKSNENMYAAHILHEYMHVIGFIHGRYDIFGKRHKTIPYRIGKIILNILEKN